MRLRGGRRITDTATATGESCCFVSFALRPVDGTLSALLTQLWHHMFGRHEGRPLRGNYPHRETDPGSNARRSCASCDWSRLLGQGRKKRLINS